MDNFDLKKFLKENKAIENLNPSIKSLNENEYYKDAEADDAEHIDALEKDMKDDKKASLKAKIKEMIVAELDGAAVVAQDYDPVYEDNDPGEEEADMMDAYADGGFLDEAKKDKEEDVEDVEVTDTEEEIPADEEMPAEEAPTGGLEDIAADMEGTEGDLMDHLMKAFQIAKGMGNEKLETQVGNTLKFFVSEYIGGGEG
jgi:hypothetical protein